jgi:transcriptional regulator with XRE-family HTH domain
MPGRTEMAKSSIRKLSQLIRERRCQLDMKQEDLARRIGTSASYISNLETGKRRPSQKLIIKLAEVLALDAHELFLYALPNLESFLSLVKTSHEESAWIRFLNNQTMRETYQITDGECEALSRLSTMGDVRSQEDFVFILKTIRRMSGEK